MPLKDGQDQVSGPQVPGELHGEVVDYLGAVWGAIRGDEIMSF